MPKGHPAPQLRAQGCPGSRHAPTSGLRPLPSPLQAKAAASTTSSRGGGPAPAATSGGRRSKWPSEDVSAQGRGQVPGDHAPHGLFSLAEGRGQRPPQHAQPPAHPSCAGAPTHRCTLDQSGPPLPMQPSLPSGSTRSRGRWAGFRANPPPTLPQCRGEPWL